MKKNDVELFLDAGEWLKAAELLRGEAPVMFRSGMSQTLEKWLSALPQFIVEEAPWLLYWLGVCRSSGNLREARGYFEKAFGLFCSSMETPGIILSWSGIVDSIAYEWNDLRDLDKWVKWYDENLRDYIPSPFPVPEIEARLVSSMVNAITFRLSSHPDCGLWLKRAYRVLENEGEDVTQRIMLGANMVFLHTLGREAYKTVHLIDYVKKLSRLPGISILGKFMCLSAEAQFSWAITADGNRCMDCVSEGLKLSEESGIHFLDHVLLAQGVHGALTACDLDKAAEYLGRMNAVLGGINRIRTSDYYYLAAWLDFLKGDMHGALQHSKNALVLSEEMGAPLPEALCHIGLAHSLFETGRKKDAYSHVETAINMARENGSDGIESMGMLFKSYFMFEKGNADEGLEVLAAGLSKWKESGHLNFPYWQPSMMSSLFIRALNAGIETEFLKFAIKKRGLVPDTPPYYCEGWPWKIRVNALGKLKVLKDEKFLNLTGKALGKPVEMLETILALGGRAVKVDSVIDMLWPDSAGDNAQRAFDTTLHRLRKFMGGNDTILLKNGKVGLNDLICYVDVWAVEHLIEKAEDLQREKRREGCESEACCIIERALSLSRGPFLDGEKNSRALDRLQDRFFRFAGWVGDNYEESGRILEAIELYRKIISADDSHEEFYRRLMACYKRLDRTSEVVAVYKRCCSALLSAYDIVPSRETEAIYRSVLKKK